MYVDNIKLNHLYDSLMVKCFTERWRKAEISLEHWRVDQKLCSHGSKQEATDFCQVCKQLLCNICGRYHILYMKTHTLVSVASLQKSKTILPTISPVGDVAICQYHPDLDIEMYCGTHDMVYCCRCIAKEHRSCSDVKEIEDVAHRSNLSTLQSLTAELTRVRTRLQTTKLDMSNDLELIQKMRVSLVEEIKALRKQFNKRLDALEQKIIAELDEEQRKLEKEIGDEIIAAEDLITASDKNKPDMTSHLDEKQIFITEKLGRVVLADGTNFLKKANVFKHPTLKFEQSAILCDAIEKSDRVGNIRRIDRKPNRIQRSTYTVKSMDEINVKMSSDKATCFINDMCQLSDGSILLIDNAKKKLKRLDDHLNVKDFLNLKSDPMGLCSVSPTEVAVRLRDKTIHFICVGKSLTYQRKVSLNNFIPAEYGMACCNNQLWIPGNQAVYVYSLSGTTVKKIDTDSQGRTIFPLYSPCHIAVSNGDTKVYIAAWEDRVVVFNNNGDLIKELRDQRLNGTRGVCVTEDDTVLVAGHYSKNVVMFDRDDNNLGELVSSEDMPTYPWSLYYDSKRCRLLAGYYGSDKIQIFELS